MYDRKIPASRLGAWTLAAMSAPLVTAASGTAWPLVLLLGLISMVSGRLFYKEKPAGAWFWAVQWFWAMVVLAWMLPQPQKCWQTQRGGMLIPLTLLLLAICAAWRGPDGAARSGGVLFWLLAGIYLVLLAAGVPAIRPGRLMEATPALRPGLLLAFLLPSAGALLPGKGSGRRWTVAAVLFATAVSLCTFGSLPPKAAASAPLGFYEAVRGMGLFRVAQRFESFLSAALTLGWFSCFSLLTALAGTAAERIHSGWGKWGPILCGVGAVAVRAAGVSGDGFWIDVFALLIWGILPQIRVKIPILKKYRKN